VAPCRTLFAGALKCMQHRHTTMQTTHPLSSLVSRTLSSTRSVACTPSSRDLRYLSAVSAWTAAPSCSTP